MRIKDRRLATPASEVTRVGKEQEKRLLCNSSTGPREEAVEQLPWLYAFGHLSKMSCIS